MSTFASELDEIFDREIIGDIHTFGNAKAAIIKAVEKRIPEKKTYRTDIAGYSRFDEYKKATAFNAAIDQITATLKEASDVVEN
jgi:hypothetical protein